MKHLLLILGFFSMAGCERAVSPNTSRIETLINPTGNRTIELNFPKHLRGKNLWYFLENQHKGTDFCGAFSVPETNAPLSIVISGEHRSAIALTESTTKEASFFGRSRDPESFPYFAIFKKDRGAIDYRDFAIFFANSERALQSALNRKFVSYPELGEDRFVVITLKEPAEVLPNSFSSYTHSQTKQANIIPAF